MMGPLAPLFAEGAQVIQVEWQSLAAFGSAIGAGLVAAAKMLATQLAKNSAETTKRHEENRQDAREAREENRALSQVIITTQGETARTLAGVQNEIQRVVERIDRLEHGSQQHQPLPAPTKRER